MPGNDKPNWILDWDSTICKVETLDFLARFILDPDQLRKFESLTDSGMDGDIPFSDSLSRRVAMLKVHRDQVSEAAEQLVDHLDPTFISRRADIEALHGRVYVVS